MTNLGYAFRTLRRSASLTSVAVLTLALGIGGNTAVFSLLNAVRIRSLPVKDPQRLVLLTDPNSGGIAYGTSDEDRSLISYSEYEALRDQNQVFSGLLAVASGQARPRPVSWGGGGPEQVPAKLVSGNYFDVFGVTAWRGRTFNSEVETPLGAHPVAVMNYDYWQRRFGLSPDVIGKTFRLNKQEFTVIGVAPPGFSGEDVGTSPALWLPLSMQAAVMPGSDMLHDPPGVSRYMWLGAIGRLKPGVTLLQAQANINAVFHTLTVAQAAEATGAESRNQLLTQHLKLSAGARGASDLVSGFINPLYVLFALVGLVLQIAITNLAGIMLAKATGRRKEFGVRMALGASRGALARQLLAECITLAVLGGALGWVLAGWGEQLLVHMVATSQFTLALDLKPDLRVLGFTLALCVLSGLLFGLAPAWQATRVDINSALQAQGRSVSTTSRRVLARVFYGGLSLGKVLVVVQVALSAALLTGAGLYVRTLEQLNSVQLGYPTDRLLVFYLNGGAAGYQGPAAVHMLDQVQKRIAALPGVVAATMSEDGLFSHTESATTVTVEGYPAQSGGQTPMSRYDSVGANYFSTVGMSVVLGRALGPQDEVSGARVGMVNETFARQFFPKSSPIGKQVIDTYPDDHNATLTIVGVAHDAKYNNVSEKPQPRFYVPLFNALPADQPQSAIFEVRTAGGASVDMEMVSEAIRGAIRDIDPNIPPPVFNAMRTLVSDSMTQQRTMAQLASFFGFLALFLAAIGLYGVMAYAVARRTGEIGIRMALGAMQGQISGMILGEILAIVGAGLAIGIPVSAAAAKLIQSQLYGVKAHDPLTLMLGAFVLLATALLAGYIPARRASRVDPLQALRYE